MKSSPHIDQFGNIAWEDEEGNRVREGDKPSFISCDGVIIYSQYGQWYRAGDKPAVIYPNGEVEYHNEKGRYFPRDCK